MINENAKESFALSSPLVRSNPTNNCVDDAWRGIYHEKKWYKDDVKNILDSFYPSTEFCVG